MTEPEKTLWDIDCPAGPCICGKPFADHIPDINGKHWFRRFGEGLDVHDSCYDNGTALWKLAMALLDQSRRSLLLDSYADVAMLLEIFDNVSTSETWACTVSNLAERLKRRTEWLLQQWPTEGTDDGK